MRHGVRKGHYLPLLPRHNIYLAVSKGDAPRFARNFRATWKRIPLGPRRRMLAYWKDPGTLAPGVVLPPMIELANPLFMGRREFGVCGVMGCKLQFNAKYFDRMPDDVAQDVIAHELAHAYQGAQGIHMVREYRDGSALFVQDGEPWGGRLEIEMDADDHIEGWGFDPESVDRWSLDVGITKVVEHKDTEDAETAFCKEIARRIRKGR
jgi:hypothetical protein